MGHGSTGAVRPPASVVAALMISGTCCLASPLFFAAPTGGPRPGDTITGRVEVSAARTDKPITELKTSVIRDDATVVLRRNGGLLHHGSDEPGRSMTSVL